LDPTILIIIVFILAPLIERLLKAGKQQPPQPPPRQQRRPHVPPPQQQAPRDEAPPRAVTRRDEEEAAAMLPDDLWEILTGERRSPGGPQRPVEPEPLEDEYEEAQSLETTSAGEWISLPPEPEPAPAPTPDLPPVPARRPSAWSDYQTQRKVPAPAERAPIRAERGYVRAVPTRDVPRVVSLEDLDIDDEARHDRFHEKLEATRRPARVQTPKAWRFTRDEDLRHAIIMSEVLGRPRGLD
jgi:hypothetical protein